MSCPYNREKRTACQVLAGAKQAFLLDTVTFPGYIVRKGAAFRGGFCGGKTGDPVVSLLLVAGCVLYAGIVSVVAYALGRVHDRQSADEPVVSVIVAARNEAANIRACLDSLRRQEYSPERFEVIVADDRSGDATPSILREISSTWPALRTVRIEAVPAGFSPKKHALSAAIALSCGEIVLQTDADCVVPPDWVMVMARRFEPGVGFVAGVAPYRTAPGVLNSFIRHEYLWNAGLSASSIALGHGTHASGRSMGFRREVFERIQGYGDSAGVLSGDDTLLLQRVVRSGGVRAVTQPHPGGRVYTDAPGTVRAFLRQRVRHFSTGRYFAPGQMLFATAVYGFHALLLAAMLLALFRWSLIIPALGAFLAKTGIDAAIALRIRKTLGLSPEWRAFLRNEFLLLLYMTVMPLAGVFFPVVWKDAGAPRS